MDDVMKKNIEEYHSAAKALFDRGSDLVFPNNNEKHTAVILEEIFLHARKDVSILCSCLNPDVWGNPEITDAFINACFRGVKFRIITQKSMDKSSKFADIIQYFNVPVQENFATELPCNFVVADKKMFRFEADASQRHAQACANRPELAQKLAEIFDTLFAQARVRECIGKAGA